MDVLLSLTGCKPARSTAYHPQTDGQTERTNRILKDYLKHYCHGHGGEWEDHLAEAEFAYNNSWQASINTTPFRLTYGCDPNVPFAMGHMGSVVGRKEGRADVFMRKMQASLTLARKFLAAAQSRQRSAADKRRRPVSYNTGDYVFWNSSTARLGRVPFAPNWIGPFKVLSGTSETHPNTVHLQLPDNVNLRHPYVNVEAIKPYAMPPGADPSADLPLPTVEIDPHTKKLAPAFTVEAIVGHQQQTGAYQDGEPLQWNLDGTPRWQYFVSWRGFDAAWDTPEPLDSFYPGSMDKIEEYHRRLQLGRVPWTADGLELSYNSRAEAHAAREEAAAPAPPAPRRVRRRVARA